MHARPRRSGRLRLLLISAALASLVAGYYLGQFWQRQPLAELSAVIYPDGKPVVFPVSAKLSAGDPDAGPWRLVFAADASQAGCRQLLQDLALVRNRLAGWPSIQQRLRLAMIDYAGEDGPAIQAPADWIDRVTGDRASLDALAAELGILPDPDHWCTGTAANSVLVAPDLRRWALIPHEQAAIMAHNIATIVQFVE